MTTIVVNQEEGWMAADRQVTSNDGDMTIACNTKIERIDIGGDEYLVAYAGHEGPAELFLDWLRDGDWDVPLEAMEQLDDDHGFTVVVLGPNGIEIADKFMRLTPIHNRYYGAGTGGPLAWAVLEATGDVGLSLETAIKLDPNSGFGWQIRYLGWETKDKDFD